MNSPAPVPSKTTAPDSKVRSTLIFAVLGVAAAIIFGIIYLFVLAPTVPDGSIGWFLFSFATGLTMIVMPCTLPLAFVIVPLSMGKGIVRGLGIALAFGLGVATMLSTYGIIAALLGGYALEFLGNDIEPIKNWVYFIAGLFALVFALSEIGLLNIHMPTYSGAAPAFIQKRGEIIKAFMLGLFLGNVGVGCPHPATPLILIEIASSGDVLYGWLMFLVHAIGRVLPLLLLAFMAVLGVNGLNWLMKHKAAVERVTGWGMVFVAGFILTLGLFTHDWWVNSGIHSALESVTQESYFNAWFNDALDQNVAHEHGLEDGVGLFGQPLWWGHWFLVLTWLIPIWWYFRKKRRALYEHPSFALQRIEREVDRLEAERSRIEETTNIDGLDPSTDLKGLKAQIAALKKERRATAERANYGEAGTYRSPVARDYEVKMLGMQRNHLILLSIGLALIFIYFLPTNFYYKSQVDDGHGGHDDHGSMVDLTGLHVMSNGIVMNGAGDVVEGAHQMPDGSIMLSDGTMIGLGGMPKGPAGATFTTDTRGLPEAQGLQFVDLKDGDVYDITASYVQKRVGNRTLRMLAYNGSVPGPFLRAPQGAEVTINFTNNTDIDQTIHSHGIRVDNNYDGVPYVTQDPVRPGDSFAYTIAFPDAGVFWYHPHTREDYGQELGLYGNYLVEPSDPEYWNDVNREAPLVIDDILINNNKIADFYKDFTNFALLGRFGNTFLVNGIEDYTTPVKAGEVVRYFVTNVSNARTYNLSIPGAKMKLVGADLGRFEREEYVDTILLSPAERAVVEVYFPNTGVYKLTQNTPTESFELARFTADEQVSESFVDIFNQIKTNAEVVSEFSSFRDYLSVVPDKEVLLTIDLSNQMVDHSAHGHSDSGTGGHDHGATTVDHSQHAHTDSAGSDPLASIQWDDPTQSDVGNVTPMIEWRMVDKKTGAINMNINDWVFTAGDLVKVRIENDAAADHVMQHPIHFHGQQFVVLARDGVANDNLAWKDTAMVFPGETVDILVAMTNPGEWMAHCHIAEHLHAGMMLGFRVQNEDGTAPGDVYRATVPAGSSHMQNMGSAMPDPMMNNSNNTVVPTRTFDFADISKVDRTYTVKADINYAKAGRLESIPLSFFDSSGNPVNLDDFVERAVVVTLVKSDNKVSFTTYPGNTVFPGAAADDHGHDDGHDHEHSLQLIPVAHAHGEVVEDGHHEGTVGRTYTVPVQFPQQGVYRGFVEFTLSGESEPRLAYFDIEVISASFSVDDFGWSKWTKWWILLIGSILLMIPLVYGVRKYVNVDKK